MKKILTISIALLVTANAFCQTKKAENNIIGKWAIEENSKQQYLNNLIRTTKKANPEAAKQMEDNQAGYLQMVAAFTFEYKADNTLEVVTPQGPQANKWLMIDGNKTLQITRGDGSIKKEQILELSATKLKLQNMDGGEAVTFVKANNLTTKASIQTNEEDLNNDKQAIQKVIEQFKAAIINKDSVGLTSLFYNNKIVWIAAGHQKSHEFIKKLDSKQQQISQQGAFEIIADPRMTNIKTEEKFYNPIITTDGEIATVTFSYKFLANQQVSNWGSESWQLVKTDSQWKIIHLLYSYNLPNVSPLPASLN